MAVDAATLVYGCLWHFSWHCSPSVLVPHLPKELFQKRPDVVGKASFWARRLEDRSMTENGEMHCRAAW